VSARLVGDDKVLAIFRTTSTDLTSIGTSSTNDREGGDDGYLAILSPQALNFASTFGWDGTDQPSASTYDARGNVYIVGRTTSRAIVTTGPPDAERAMVSKYVFGSIALIAPRVNDVLCLGRTVSIVWSTSDVANGETYFVDVRPTNGDWQVIGGPIASGSSFPWLPTSGEYRDDLRYVVRVRSESGLTAEMPGTFAFSQPLTITQQPPSAIARCTGDSVVLRVDVTGSNLRPQWRKDGKVIDGATGSELIFRGLDQSQAGTYDVVLVGGCQQSLTSSSCAVTVTTAPVIARQPLADTVRDGEILELSVEASGAGLRYQWTRDGMLLPMQTTSTLRIVNATSSDAGSYACAISNGCGSVTSDIVDVVVSPSTSVDDDPASAWRITGGTAASTDLQLSGPVSESVEVAIVDAGGRTLLRDLRRQVRTMTIDVSPLPTGRYWIILTTSQGITPLMFDRLR
jgi:hypothetical protein